MPNDPTTTTRTEFQVKRTDLTTHRLVTTGTTPLEHGQVRVAVDRFAFTANNLTYGAAGDFLGYWQFFPAADNADGAWGILPVWAFADVIESTVDDVPVGDRWYGYFPPATSIVMEPTKIRDGSLIDGTACRQKLPPLYNRYQRVLASQDYDRAFDDNTALLAPLHLTSFCIVDQLAQNSFYEAAQTVVISASSKTSLGTAFGLSELGHAPKTVGITSERNVGFVDAVGLYDQVVTYDAIDHEISKEPTVIVDMAGNPTVTEALVDLLGDSITKYIGVGLTHWDELGDRTDRPAIEVEMFFAPSYILERAKAMEPGKFDHESRAFIMRSAVATSHWMTIEHHDGLVGLEAIYDDVARGMFPPSAGAIVTM